MPLHRPTTIFALTSLLLSALVSTAAASDSVDMHNYLKGRFVYQKQCVPCHGRTGRGDGPWSKDVRDKPRNFRAGIFKFRTTPYGYLPTEDDLRRTIRRGIPGTMMPIFSKLTDAEVTALIVYLQNLSPRWKDESLRAEAVPLPETPTWFTDEAKRKKHAELGKSLFQKTCASCHGSEGKGNGPASQGLKDAWENEITPADLSREHHKSGDDPGELFRTIALGLDGTPMVGFLETLKGEEIWDLVAFIKSIEKPAE